MKNLCIIGAGPAGLYTSKFLLPHFNITAYDQDSKPLGLFHYFHTPKKSYFNDVLTHPNFHLHTNTKASQIKDKYDAYVIATGGECKQLEVKGKEFLTPSLDVIKQYKSGDSKLCDKFKNVMVIGCGNVTMDLIKYLVKDASNLYILCRSGPFDMACTNNELRDVYELSNVKIEHNTNLEEEWKRTKEKLCNKMSVINERNLERRKKLMRTEKQGMKSINFLFYTSVEKIEKMGNKLFVALKTKNEQKEVVVDHVINSVGFKVKPIEFIETKKPIFFVGWARNAHGNLSDIKQDAYEVANNILQFFKRKGK